jgi:hypothetical protein
MRKPVIFIVVCLACPYAFQSATPKFAITPEVQQVMDHIRADSLRGDLSFIASDLLEGRDTPSRGLDVAAEYIAAQFRRAGLEPGGDDGYFQTAKMDILDANLDGFELKLSRGDEALTAGPGDVSVSSTTALDLQNAAIFKLDMANQALIDALSPDQVSGKVILQDTARGAPANSRAVFQKLRAAKPAVIITIARNAAGDRRPRSGGRLVDPAEVSAATPLITLTGAAAAKFYDSLPPGPADAVAAVHLAKPHETPVTPRNVIGILRGSDAAIKDTYLLVTAHYDHLGMRPEAPGDHIYNGANDDGSGTVSVMELARALSTLKAHPRRSIVFMTFFGEEKGLLGSRYYAHHPLLPLEKTIGQLNLEQVGRTDDSEGPQVGTTSVTGFDYSTLSDSVQEAGRLAGIKIYKHPRNSDLYFASSDNASLAEAGVPAHTLSVSYQFPDYHRPGDEWQKIDYDNMAKVDRMVALAVLMVAGSDQPPSWNEKNPRTAGFVKVWQQHHGQ